MGARGPKPTPTAALKLRGSNLAKNRVKHEPAQPAGLPVRPDWTDPELMAIWDWLVEQLTAMRLLSSADQVAMRRYCRLALAGERSTDTDEQLKIAAACRAFETDYGLSPSARARIGISLSRLQAPAPKTMDPASEFAGTAKEG